MQQYLQKQKNTEKLNYFIKENNEKLLFKKKFKS